MMIQEGVNMLPYLAPFDDLMRQVMGPTSFVYPLKLVRVVYPTSFVPQQPGGTVHKDYVAVQDMFTTWVPLVDVPEGMGGLAVRAGTQEHAAFLPRNMNPAEPGWSTADFRPGDVLVFHCLTSHAALPESVGSVSDLGRVPLAAGGGSGAAAGSCSTSTAGRSGRASSGGSRGGARSAGPPVPRGRHRCGTRAQLAAPAVALRGVPGPVAETCRRAASSVGWRS